MLCWNLKVLSSTWKVLSSSVAWVYFIETPRNTWILNFDIFGTYIVYTMYIQWSMYHGIYVVYNDPIGVPDDDTIMSHILFTVLESIWTIINSFNWYQKHIHSYHVNFIYWYQLKLLCLSHNDKLSVIQVINKIYYIISAFWQVWICFYSYGNYIY